MIRRIYYHDGLDIGGAEGMVNIVAASRAFVLSVGHEAIPGYEETPAVPGHGRVYTIDEQGWMISCVHLKEIHPSVRPGTTQALCFWCSGKESSFGRDQIKKLFR